MLIRCPHLFLIPLFKKTESRWDDTGYDVTAYDVLTDFNEPNDATAPAPGVIQVLKLVYFFNQKQTFYL